jgi:hypothetical protein
MKHIHTFSQHINESSSQEIMDFCKKYKISIEQFRGQEEIPGDFRKLSNLKSIPSGFNPKVEGNLTLSSIYSLPDGFSPVVGGDLELHELNHLPEGFSPTVGRDLHLNYLNRIPYEFTVNVGDNLILDNVYEVGKGFSPTVGGNLDLGSLRIYAEGFSPIVGGNLILNKMESIPLKGVSLKGVKGKIELFHNYNRVNLETIAGDIKWIKIR